MSDPFSGEQLMTHVYQFPAQLSYGEYCFGGPVPISFLNVDWFKVPTTITINEIKDYVRKKRYYDPKSKYLVLCEDDSCFVIGVEP